MQDLEQSNAFVVSAADELAHGSVEAAERYLGLAERGLASLPGTRLLLARQRGDLPTMAEAAPWPQATA